MPIAHLIALMSQAGPLDFGKPVAKSSYYLAVEAKLPDGTPDLEAQSNHWKQATDEFFAYADTRKMDRDTSGRIHLAEAVLEYDEGGAPYQQEGKAPPGLTSEFHYVIGPGPAGHTKLTFSAYDVAPTQQVVEYVVKTTIVETEVRLVNRRQVTRTLTTETYGIRFVGLGLNEKYDPVTGKRSNSAD